VRSARVGVHFRGSVTIRWGWRQRRPVSRFVSAAARIAVRTFMENLAGREDLTDIPAIAQPLKLKPCPTG
jgi:hypothetical protein